MCSPLAYTVKQFASASQGLLWGYNKLFRLDVFAFLAEQQLSREPLTRRFDKTVGEIRHLYFMFNQQTDYEKQ